MDTAILEWIHQQSSSTLDVAFRFSHELGTFRNCSVAVVAFAVLHAARREMRSAMAWIVLGVAVGLLPEIIKELTSRPRPALWPQLIDPSGFSFPSGHATAGAAFYPFLAWTASRAQPRGRWLYWTLGIGLGAFVGVGRLYLGVHWPSDVLAGWILGATLTVVVVRWLSRPTPGNAASVLPKPPP